MHIKKFDFDYGRRMLLQKAAIGAGAGVLAPLWSHIANAADASKAYPDELLHIEAFTKGKIKVGDVISADNVDVVKDLFDPITYKQIKTMGRKINIIEPPKSVAELFPADYLEVTLKNKGKAKFDANGNVVDEAGNPWIGGLPFPDAKTGEEAIANLTLSWGRHDYSQYAIRQWDMDPGGDQAYQYDFVWAELQAQARTDGSVFQNRKDLLRLQSVWFTGPQDVSGTSFLNTWYYDQRKFPELKGYLPAFKRVRDFPTNQRFEPLLPGVTWFLSDAWAAGDPMLTWGNYKIVERRPWLAPVSGNWRGSKPNWEIPAHGGPKGKTFFDSYFSLVPECIVLEAEPVGYPRAPVGKKRVWIDVRNQLANSYITFDRRGEVWKSFEGAYGRLQDGGAVEKDAKGNVDWSWAYYLSHDSQTNRMSRGCHTQSCAGGYKSLLSAGNVDVYNKYLTVQAIQRLGAA
ncbi:MAG: DUF1329 domain-containing protein [Rudaea sp.]|uniref:DUF1329 domain-containing protein n=1 Tax=unclassified Rudaea TaxID=2627037 RepID=UPI0010F8B4B0|nr:MULTISPECIES: DUF1329 domain-containing protein [unclassified Rudaea]MBN8887098.1 DUF1329 domain-containing protein [Rudaea sp.]